MRPHLILAYWCHPHGGNSPGRAARGSAAPRKVACRCRRGDARFHAVQGHRRALRGGSPVAAPFGSRRPRSERGTDHPEKITSHTSIAGARIAA
jgi:hypothetical protein